MKKTLALAATSVATLAIMAGPATLTVAAQDTGNDVRIETGWVKHNKSFKGQGRAFGRARFLGGDYIRFNGGKEQRDRKNRKHGGGFGILRGVDLSITETEQVRDALRTKQASILEAMKEKMDARLETIEAKNIAVLEAWEIEDADEREDALETIHEEARDAQKEVRVTFREAVKSAYETFTTTIKSLLGLDN